MKTIRVKIEFLRELLGTNPSNEQIYRDYIAGKAIEAGVDLSDSKVDDEVEHLNLEDEFNKGKTIFFKDKDGNPMIRDYMLLGFFKSAWRACKVMKGSESSKVKTGIAFIDRHIRVFPEYIPVQMAPGTTVGTFERPLRAMTMQGERVALAASDEVKRGATAEFVIVTLNDDVVKAIEEWLKYGRMVGLGQNRSAGYGSFKLLSFEVEDVGGVDALDLLDEFN